MASIVREGDRSQFGFVGWSVCILVALYVIRSAYGFVEIEGGVRLDTLKYNRVDLTDPVAIKESLTTLTK